MDLRPDLFAHDDPVNIFRIGKPEGVSVYVVLLTESHGGQIKRLEVAVKHLMIGNVADEFCVRVDMRIVVVKSVNVLCEQDSIGTDLCGTDDCRGIR